MSFKKSFMATTAMSIAVAAIMGAGCAPSSAQDANALANADKDGKDWMSYHGSYQSWHYSPLSQIDASNVKKLKIAFIHQVGHSTRGVQSMPLAKDGVIYYSASYDKVFAVKGDTGEVLWSFIPKLDDDLVARQTHSPYNRGMAMSDGKLYIGTVDGRLFALPAIIRAYKALVAQGRGEATADVTSATALSATQRASLAAALKQKLGKTVTLTEHVDPSLIGGLQVKVGSQMIDSSLKTKLSAIKVAMKEVG